MMMICERVKRSWESFLSLRPAPSFMAPSLRGQHYHASYVIKMHSNLSFWWDILSRLPNSCDSFESMDNKVTPTVNHEISRRNFLPIVSLPQHSFRHNFSVYLIWSCLLADYAWFQQCLQSLNSHSTPQTNRDEGKDPKTKRGNIRAILLLLESFFLRSSSLECIAQSKDPIKHEKQD